MDREGGVLKGLILSQGMVGRVLKLAVPEEGGLKSAFRVICS